MKLEKATSLFSDLAGNALQLTVITVSILFIVLGTLAFWQSKRNSEKNRVLKEKEEAQKKGPILPDGKVDVDLVRVSINQINPKRNRSTKTGQNTDSPTTEESSNKELDYVEEPKAESVAVEEPKVESEAVEEPKVESVAVEEPKAESEAVEEPKAESVAVEEPKVESVAVEEPKAESVAVEEPKVESVAVEEPKAESEAVEEPKAESEAVEEPKVESEAVEEPKAESEAVEEPKAESEAVEEPSLSLADEMKERAVEVPNLDNSNMLKEYPMKGDIDSKELLHPYLCLYYYFFLTDVLKTYNDMQLRNGILFNGDPEMGADFIEAFVDAERNYSLTLYNIESNEVTNLVITKNTVQTNDMEQLCHLDPPVGQAHYYGVDGIDFSWSPE